MTRTLLLIFQQYGLDAVQLGIITFAFWKLFTNHLLHISCDIKENKSNLKKVNDNINLLKERVSNIEGKLSK